MRPSFRIIAAAFCFSVIAPAAMIAPSAPAYAAKPSISQKVGKPLQEAQALAQKGKFSEALVKAKEAQALPGKTPYEEFVVQDFLAYLYVQLKDYTNAAAAYEAALNSGQVPPEEVGKRLKTLSQLYYQNENYAKSISYGERYLKEVGQDESLAALVAQAYYLQKDYGKALQKMQALVRAAEQKGKKPEEVVLQVLLSSAYALNDDATSKAALIKLVELYPSPDYWTDLFSLLHSQKGMTERLSLEVFRLKIASGALTDPEEYMEMAETSLILGLPGEAQRVMEKGFASGILGVSANAAREQRLLKQARTDAAADKATLAQQAGEAAATVTGDDDVKLGEAYETYGDNAAALKVLSDGLAKPGVKAPDEAQLTLGRVLLNLGQKAEARTAFGGIQTDPKIAELARVWIILSSQAPQ